MLVIAQPRSASTSLMDTLGKVTGLNACQKFNHCKRSYKKMFGPPLGFNFLQHHHSDFRKVAFAHVLSRINDTKTIYKQHFPPTKEMLNGIKDCGRPVVILLRNPEDGMKSYEKLGNVNYKESLNDLKMFGDRYRKIEGLSNVLIITYDELINDSPWTIKKILNHFKIQSKANLESIELSKKRVPSEFSEYLKDKRVAFVGPAPTLLKSGLGEKIDSYDIVIRMKQPIVPEKIIVDYGKKTDVIFCNLDAVGYKGAIRDHYPDWQKAGLKWVCMARRKKARRALALSSGIREYFKFKRVEKGFYKSCKQKCHCRGRNIPFTGTVAILDVLRTEFKELFIAGFDYYKSSSSGKCGHYNGFNTKQFESKVDYQKYYNTIYSTGNLAYRHNAKNDINCLKKAIQGYKKSGKNIILGDDFKGALGL